MGNSEFRPTWYRSRRWLLYRFEFKYGRILCADCGSVVAVPYCPGSGEVNKVKEGMYFEPVQLDVRRVTEDEGTQVMTQESNKQGQVEVEVEVEVERDADQQIKDKVPETEVIDDQMIWLEWVQPAMKLLEDLAGISRS